jgi:hypothetical protein
MIEWEIEAVELVGCNCAYGCPCQFNAPPTHGNCHTVGGYQINKGRFGETSLDGVRMATIATWPGAIHDGGGTAQAVVDEAADEEQRNAVLTIMAGRETDPGTTIWNVLAATFETFNTPLFKPIDMTVDVEARRGHVRIEGLLDMSAEPIRNPVTDEEHRARIDLPDGFEYTVAEMGSGTFSTGGKIEVSSKDSYAQFAYLHLGSHGVVRG